MSGTSSPPPADERAGHVSPHRETDLATLLAGPAADADLVRLVTCGSVDDGKSTLIGRLLYDTKQVFVDQMEHVEETSERRGDGYVNLALLTDGLRAEREQGITIDVAYRSFVTEKRRFQLADAPGHVQYTRNMVTGASTADIAVVLLDARKGVIEQTRRHTLIVSLLGVPHVVFAVNKMDLVDFDEARFREIEQELDALTAQLGVRDALAVPIAALHGDNVVDETERMSWWTGPTLLAHLEGIETSGDRNLSDRRFPVQWVIRPMTDEHHDYRGYAGQVAGGVWRAGDDVLVLPSGLRTRVASVDSAGGPHRGGRAGDVGDDPPRGRDRRSPRRHARRPRRPARHGARARGNDLLDERAPAAARRATRGQAHDPQRAGRGRVDRRRRRPRHARAARGDRDGAERHRHACGCGSPAPSWSTRTRSTAPPARSS